MRHLLQKTHAIGDICPICRMHCDTRFAIDAKSSEHAARARRLWESTKK